MDIFQLKMIRAALRQGLRDQAESLTQEEIDRILDQIIKLTKVIEELEKK